MLKKGKIAVGILTALLCALPVAASVSAAEAFTKLPGIEISTDKNEYSGDDQIKETVTIDNTTNSYLTNVTLSGSIPEGYTTIDGKEYPAQWTQTISKLSMGEETSVTVTFVKKATDAMGSLSTPTTGDSNRVWIYAGICIASATTGIILIKKKKVRNGLALFLAVAMIVPVCQVGTHHVYAAENQEAGGKTAVASKDIVIDGKKVALSVSIAIGNGGLSYEGYTQVWGDEFNGTALNLADWNVEGHEPGWVNAELQRYIYENEDYSQNIFLQDGKLVIKPIKTVNPDGSVSYSSGRINTQGNQEFTYGLFEARVKVPEGQGYLPAFWLMAADENLYGQWPRCGEIDIMEVHGSATETSYGTIHYGNPHKETQGTYTLNSGSYSDGYHTFAVEWEPGEIKWYVDGVLFHKANDWYSVTEGQGEIAYPAPFDQPFYMILNLAVGGSWVGYPDETTDFDNATYEVDYVRVYQRESYDENVTKPVTEVVLREPDANGNYVINGDFAVAEDLTDEEAWIFLTAQEGEATAEIKNNEIYINTTKAGTQDYSVQLVQPNLPMKKGGTYTLTFEAYADAARTMKVDISAPDRSWIRYLADTTVDLTTTKKTYTYTFSMTGEDDANGRLEFNLGNTASIAGVYISNVKLVMSDYEEIVDDGTKVMLADGNYVYNGLFQEGADRMEYWEIDNKANAEISVTNLADRRRLKVVVPAGTTASNPVVIAQSELAMADGANYALSYDVQGNAGTSMDVVVSGQSAYTVDLTGEEQLGNTYKFTAVAGSQKNLKFIFSEPGTYYLDNVRIDEDSLIKNGSFSAGLAGYEPFVDGSASATYVVDSLTEDNAIDFTITNTGDAAWKVQLKQNNVELENEQWYRLSFDAKSSINRQLMFAIQRDGSVHTNASGGEDWTPYSGEKIVDLTSAYQNYSVEFQMTEPTDLQSILSISMGAVGGTQITESHRICIDNIKLEKIDSPVITPKPVGEELLKDTTFSDAANNWGKNITIESSVTFEDGKSVWVINNVGSNDFDVQLSQTGIQLDKGSNYELKFTAESTAGRSIKWDFMSTGYNWYCGESVELEANTPKEVVVNFTMNKDTDINTLMTISMGKMTGRETPTSTIILSDFSLKKVEPTTPEVTPSGNNLVPNGDFVAGQGAWVSYVATDAAATLSFDTQKAVITTTALGTNAWDVQLGQSGISVEPGNYRLSLTGDATTARTIQLSVSYAGATETLYRTREITLQPTSATYTYDFTVDATDTNATIQVNMGNFAGAAASSTITLDDIQLVKVEASNMIANGNFADGGNGWSTFVQGDNVENSVDGAVATTTFADGKVIFDITDVGTADWHIQLKQEGIQLEQGATYTLTFNATSTVARTIKVSSMDTGNVKWYGGGSVALEANTPQTITMTLSTGANPTDANAYVQVGMGQMFEDGGAAIETLPSTVTLSDFTLTKN